MEQWVRSLSDKPLSSKTLASLRSLVINPHTSDSTLSAVLQTLAHSLQLSHDSVLLHQVLKLLTDLSSRCPDLSPLILDLLRSISLSSGSTRGAAELLSTLASISEQNSFAVPNLKDIDDELYVSLCFGQRVSVRIWLLRNAEKFRIRSSLLFTVFLGFTSDPYPYVREAALDGLVGLSKTGEFESLDAIEGCYCRAVELLKDTEDCVRSAAVRAVCEWGQMLVACDHKNNRRKRSDAVFLQICTMVRDMSTGVKVEAFDALGKIAIVSEAVLLQTLSKKVIGIINAKNNHAQCTAESLEIPVAGAAGAFVHGLEDEFYEVRKSAISSLRALIDLSAKFAGEALNLLMDLLNDPSMAVRLETLETLHHMAICGHFKVQEMHMHAILGSLIDKSRKIRSEMRKILKLVKLTDLKLFKQCISSLLECLEKYPQDEADILAVLFHIGQSHGNFTGYIIKTATQEIDLDSRDKLDLNDARKAAYLVLIISVPLSDKQNVPCIAPQLFSYAITMLGRISHSLHDVMDQKTLLAFLSHCYRLYSSSGLESNEKEPFLHVCQKDTPNFATARIRNLARMSSEQTSDETSEIQSQIRGKPSEPVTSDVESHLEEPDEVKTSMNLISKKIKFIWSLVKSGCTKEALTALRACKEEVSLFAIGSPQPVSVLAFMLLYLQVIKYLARVWEHFVPTRKRHSYEIGEVDLLLGKLESRLRELKCRFVGLSKEEKLQILDLIILSCLLRLSKVEICCYLTTMKRLSSAISQAEFLHKEGCTGQSKFFLEIKSSLHEIGTSYCCPFLLKKLLDHFSLEQFVLCRNLRHIHAELEVPDNDSENPLFFVSGLPVAIPCEITLHNISNEGRLWLRITIGEESIQFVFLNLNLNEGSEEVRKFTFIAPVYITPKAVSFTLIASIAMECLLEDADTIRSCPGPKHALTYLCREKEIYLSAVSKD